MYLQKNKKKKKITKRGLGLTVIKLIKIIIKTDKKHE